MLVSDERVKKIGATQEELREAVEQDIRLIGIRVRLIFLLNGAGELLADRAERIQKEQAVIAKIEREIARQEEKRPKSSEESAKDLMGINWYLGVIMGLRIAKWFIRNPKEADGKMQKSKRKKQIEGE